MADHSERTTSSSAAVIAKAVDDLDKVSRRLSRAGGMAVAAGLFDLVGVIGDAGCDLDAVSNDLEELIDVTCHCGRPVHVYDEPGMEGHTRGLCLECSTVRCDVEPGACATAVTQTATCKCGRIGQCSTCCCVRVDHVRWPDKPCSLCGHVGKVAVVDG